MKILVIFFLFLLHSIQSEIIVHLFNWPWKSIGKECKFNLNGVDAIQISPTNEHILMKKPWQPWWQRYQPVSYELTSHSGTKKELMEMIKTCQLSDIKVYADVVLNHMSGDDGVGFDHSLAHHSIYKFPKVGYSSQHFNRGKCSHSIENFTNSFQLRECELLGLSDLDQSNEFVQKKIVEHLNELLEMGIAGFRVDAAKHMYVEDLEKIWSSLNRQDIFSYFEVIDEDNEISEVRAVDYIGLGHVTEFRYGSRLADCIFGRNNLTISDINTLLTSSSGGLLPDNKSIIFVDNHDTQRKFLNNLVSHRNAGKYLKAVALMLAWDYGENIKLMSSFRFVSNDQSPPLTLNGELKEVHNSRFECTNDWLCEHRWKAIQYMLNFRNKVNGSSVENWNKGRTRQQISFSRGNVGHFVLNNDVVEDWLVDVPTSLEDGNYCADIERVGNCSKLVEVRNGRLVVDLGRSTSFIAITSEEKIAS
ncbi:hypothetical protein SNEBB_000698 [Seison nebaliae]|nr:hypothetical protein SNEBB_000698 [Seison nebaliae]